MQKKADTKRLSQAYGRTLTLVSPLSYIFCVLTASDYDWTSVVGSLQINQNKWARMSSILVREGENLRVSGTYFKGVDQAVILFGSKTWVMNPHMRRAGSGVSIWWPSVSQESKCGIFGMEVGIKPLWRNRCGRRG